MVFQVCSTSGTLSNSSRIEKDVCRTELLRTDCGADVFRGERTAQAADLELHGIDKDDWVQIFDDTKYDMKNSHVNILGPQEFAILKDLSG